MRASFVLAACLAAFSTAGIAVAASPGQGLPQKVASQNHSTAGTHNKASSFAPHPTKRRTFGAPIQAPIMTHVAPKKKPAPK